MELKDFKIPEYQRKILKLVLAGFHQRNLDVKIIAENQSLYLQSGSFMRGNLSAVLEDLTNQDPSEQTAYIAELVAQAELVINSEPEESLEYGKPSLDSPYLAILAQEDIAPVYSWGSLGGGINKYVLQHMPQGYEYCRPRQDRKTIWQAAISGTDRLDVADVVTLEEGIIAIRGVSENFASRVLNMPNLLKETGIEYSDLGVFYAVPCESAILVLPIHLGRAQQQAVTLVQYVGDLVGNPEFVAELGVLGECSYYWNPLAGDLGSSICYEQERIVDGEPYIELKIPPHLDKEEGL